MKILFTGGGTGGHIFPIIAVAREMRKIQFSSSAKDMESLNFFYLGPKDDFAEILLSQEEIRVKSILAGKLRRYVTFSSLLQNFVDLLFKTPIGFFQAFSHIFFTSPDFIFSKGGYGSLPAVFAGRILGIPIFLHESDSAPGLANRILSRSASIIFTSFPKTANFPASKTILVGNPIRREILDGSVEEAQRIFSTKRNKPLILILGGSQGAQRINDVILDIFSELLNNFEVIHQCGEQNFKGVRAESNIIMNKEQEPRYHLYPFLREEELKHALKACDLIISRAGSSSIFEIAAVGKPSILIPLPEAAQNHQAKNSLIYAQGGAALLIEEANLTHNFFLGKLKYLFSNPGELERMGELALKFSKPDAARIIAQDIIGYLFGE